MRRKNFPILDAFRDRPDLHDVPFLLGGLGNFLPDHQYQGHPDPDLSNYIHANRAPQREFGVRYYEQFLNLEEKAKIFRKKSSEDLAIVNAFEAL